MNTRLQFPQEPRPKQKDLPGFLKNGSPRPSSIFFNNFFTPFRYTSFTPHTMNLAGKVLWPLQAASGRNIPLSMLLLKRRIFST